MTVYSLVLFVHVLCAMALFVALALEGGITFRIRAAQSVEQARFFVGAFHRLKRLYIPSFLGILFGGAYLASVFGQPPPPWLVAALGGTLVLMLVGGLVTGVRMRRLQKAFEQTDAAFSSMTSGLRDRALIAAYAVKVGLALGLVFLMTVKPALGVSLAALAGGVLLGLAGARFLGWDAASVRECCGIWRPVSDAGAK